jgi:lysozyme
MKTGADISHHQQTFDAKHYKNSGEDFVVLKATDAEDGSLFTDHTFAARWHDAGRHKLPRGAYHFARPSHPVRAQADHFLAVVQAAGFRAGDTWALDLEHAEGQGPARLVDWADKWIAQVRAELGGVGLFYSGPGFITGPMGRPDHIPGGALTWVARYNKDIRSPWQGLQRPAAFPDPPAVWQRTDGKKGRTKSVASVGLCDYNEMTDAAFAALFSGDDLTTDELLDALESPRGMKLLRKVILSSPGDDGDAGSLFSKVVDIQGDVDKIKGKVGA